MARQVRLERLSTGENAIFADKELIGYISDADLLAHALATFSGDEIDRFGESIERSAPSAASSDVDHEVLRKTKELMQKGNLSPSKALAKVLGADDDLARRYHRAHHVEKR